MKIMNFYFRNKSGTVAQSLTGLSLTFAINFPFTSSLTFETEEFKFQGQNLFTITLSSEAKMSSLVLTSNLLGSWKVNEVFFQREPHGRLAPMSSVMYRTEFIQEFRVDFLRQHQLSENVIVHLEVYILPNMSPFEFQLIDTHLLDDLWASAEKKILTDFELVIQDHTFFAHRAILAARSAHFSCMLTSDFWAESRTGKVIIPDAPAKVFEQFLYFLYKGSVQPSVDYEKLLVIADKYQIDSLVSLCKAKINRAD